MNYKEKQEIYNAYVEELKNLSVAEIEERIKNHQRYLKVLAEQIRAADDVWEKKLEAFQKGK